MGRVEMTSEVLANAFKDYEYDKFQSLDLRVVMERRFGLSVPNWGSWAGGTRHLGKTGLRKLSATHSCASSSFRDADLNEAACGGGRCAWACSKIFPY